MGCFSEDLREQVLFQLYVHGSKAAASQTRSRAVWCPRPSLQRVFAVSTPGLEASLRYPREVQVSVWCASCRARRSRWARGREGALHAHCAALLRRAFSLTAPPLFYRALQTTCSAQNHRPFRPAGTCTSHCVITSLMHQHPVHHARPPWCADKILKIPTQ